MSSEHSQASLTFDEAIELSMELVDFERSTHFPDHSQFHLERVVMLAERLDHVEKAVPTVHVTGTKGKGSTCALITSILTSAGYKVGFYSSPHLHSLCERVRVGLEPISRKEFAAIIPQIWPTVEAVGQDGGYGGVTFFEMMTALALVHFRNVGADLQVMEVGLGGRLDATNIVTPEVSVITSISLDHIATLGDTIAKIAREKAGIIKQGVPCVIAPQPESDAVEVFDEVARQRDSEMMSVEERYSWRAGDADTRGQALRLFRPRSKLDLWTPLLGDYQLENIATAVAAIDVLRDRGFNVPDDAVVAGVKKVSWPARFQVFEREGKTLVVDGAHNPYSVRRLLQSLRRLVSVDNVVLVFSALGGHSAEGMLEELSGLNPRVVAVQSRHPRSSRADRIAQSVATSGLDLVAQSDTVAGGLRIALETANAGDLILCTGSLALAAEVLEELEGIEPEIYENLRGPVHRASTDQQSKTGAGE